MCGEHDIYINDTTKVSPPKYLLTARLKILLTLLWNNLAETTLIHNQGQPHLAITHTNIMNPIVIIH